MFPKFQDKYEQVPDDENLQVKVHPRKGSLLQIILIFILSGGWAISSIYYWKSLSSPKLTLGPIPRDVLEPRIKKIFNKDERYIGPSMEANRHWDALVAGRLLN